MDGIGKTKANLAEEIEELRHMVEDFREGDKQIQLLSSITEQVADSVITTDLDYKITYVNPSFQQMYGYSRDELLGQSPDILNASPSSKEIQKDIYETVSSGGVWQGEIENRRKDGSTFLCELTVFPVKDEKGNVFAYAGTQRDITERKKDEQEVKKSNALLKAIIDGTPDAVFVKDLKGRYLLANKRVLETFARSLEEVTGKDDSELFEAETARVLMQTDREIMATGQTRTFEECTSTKDGAVTWLTTKAPWRDSEGNVIGVLGVSRDVTERKQAQDALRESEECYRILAERNPHGIQEIDAYGTIIFANEAHHEMYGYQPGELTGRSITDFLLLDSQRDELSDYLKILVKDRPPPMPYHQKILTAHGKERDIEVAWNYLRDAEGSVTGFISVLTDITDRKKAEEKLKQEALMRGTLLDNLPCIAMILKKGTREIVASNEMARQVGAIPGKTCYQTYAQRDDPCPFCHAPELWATDEPKQLEVEYRGVYYEDIWVPLTEELYVHYIFDITDRKQAEEKLKTARHEAEAANIAKSQFLANMSHEIRTPMSVITGFANLLAMEELSDEQKIQATLIKKAGKSLLRIIDDVLDFSRIEAGKLEVRAREFPLKKLLDRVESMMQPLAAKKGLDFELSCHKRLPTVIDTDEDRLAQCLVNLIGNAIKFTDKGSINLKVSLEKRRKRSFVRFDVKDTGMGIPLDKHESIFASFTQVDGSHTRRQGGTGLGLTITKELAGLLGGELSFTSQVGAGSVFSLLIPARVDETMSILPRGGDRSEESVSKPQPSDNLKFRGRVLVAEDEEGSQILADRILTRLGLEVVITENGEEAIEKALHESWDLIFMDIQMPVLNGYKAVRKLRQNGITTPIIALTAYAMPGDRKKCMDAGCDGYISKPFELKELQEVLSRHISIAGSES